MNVAATLLFQASPFGLVFCHVHKIQWSQICINLLREAEKNNNVHLTWYNKNIFLCLFRLLLLLLSSSLLFFFLYCIASPSKERTVKRNGHTFMLFDTGFTHTHTHTHILRVSLFITFFLLFSSMCIYFNAHARFYTVYFMLKCSSISWYSMVLIHLKSQGSRCCKDASKNKR